jgi:hypothetical protein
LGDLALKYEHAEIVLKAVQDHLLSGKVAEIAALPRVDADGDPIVEIRVSVDSDFTKLDANELFMLGLHVRDAMIKVGDDSFPMLRILTKKDWVELQNETA